VAVALTDATVAVVDFELGTGIAADLPPAIDGIRLMIEVTGGTVGAATADISAALGVGDHMVGTRYALVRHVAILSSLGATIVQKSELQRISSKRFQIPSTDGMSTLNLRPTRVALEEKPRGDTWRKDQKISAREGINPRTAGRDVRR
jgi:hypothetical protein